jgi:hypothetical protein
MNASVIRRIDTQRPKPRPEPESALPPADDGRELAGELAAAFGTLLEQYRSFFPQTDADKQVTTTPPEGLERILQLPPDQVQWSDLERLAHEAPAQGRGRWREVQEAARSELRTGHRAARALEIPGDNCWVRAQFLALRNGLHEAWQPRNDLEINLLDQMAQFETLRMHWCEILAGHTALAHVKVRRGQEDESKYERPPQTAAQAIAGAMRMAETCQRLYLRALRALIDLRRRPTLIVRSAKQVNVGERQVNVCGT